MKCLCQAVVVEKDADCFTLAYERLQGLAVDYRVPLAVPLSRKSVMIHPPTNNSFTGAELLIGENSVVEAQVMLGGD